VEEFTTIYLSEGVYSVTAPITKRGLIFEPRDADKQVFIVSSDGPAITIKLTHEDFVVFKKIIFMHVGDQIGKKFLEAAPFDIKWEAEINKKAIQEFDIKHSMDCLVMVIEGGVIMRDCQLTLNSMPKRMKSKTPCIVTMPRTFINMTSCELKGNDTNFNTAAIFINSHVFVSDCQFSDFKSGCIFSLGKPHSEVGIQDCTITNCHLVGIYCQGQGAVQTLTRLKISQINGIGISVAKGNMAKIKGCEISKTKVGIQVVSAQPTIMMCNLDQN
jgi:hypothetical protein